ncbi:carboxypeptidase-like regulatory domain-containing protein [Granulicella sp. dw_53]|uniref:TonB-dependent receptor n=1 Tax=Granulicella sp. dw_53 TaxID=2719792 RepID=UPI001BD57447|nr:carboxypeptidase-like regulatory domain-containing protein [Granulicella sp. dw_53]
MKATDRTQALRRCIVGIFLALTVSAIAQVEKGRFVGRITDPQDAGVPGASVKVTNAGTNIVQTAVADGSGNFVITPVEAGFYSLSVTAPGFETTTSSNIEVQVGQIVREDLKLRVGSSTVTVEVTTAQPLLTTDSATVGQVITNQQLTDLPLNGRGFFRLAQLTPGAALLAPTGNSLAIRPEVVNGNTISGIRGSATSFLLDGVDVSEQHQGGTFIQTSIDALQEFSIQQSPYSAEYNRGGAFFNATVKSGTNRYHGGIFEFIRNDKLDARNFFALTRQILKRNQFGGDLGGPVVIPHLYSGKDRTFFFFNYEGQRLRQGLIFNSIVPNDAQRNGNFGTKTIYDPLLTTTVNGNPVRVPFANNTIPTARLSSAALAIQQFNPRQNTSAGTFSATPSQAIDFNQYTLRLDHTFNSHNRLFARWIYVQNREVDPNSSPQLGTANLTSIGQDIAVGLITNIGTNMVNEVRAHYLPSHVRLQAFLQGPDFNTQFGVSGFAAQLRPTTGGSFPDYSWSGYTSLTGSAFDQRPKSQDRKAFEGTENFTILKGRQSLKFGTLIRYYQWLGYDSQTYAGQFSFNGNASGDAYADFLLGYPSAVTRAYPADNFGGQQTYKQFFVQDDIRLSSRLTMNIGLRYEYSPWLGGYKGQIGTFDPTQAKPIIVSGSGAIPDLTAQSAAPAAYQFFGQYIQTSSTAGLPSNITYTDKTQFGPRIGISYALTPKTVVRGGFGMFYEPEGTSGRVNLSVLPYRLSETVNQTQNVTPTRTLANFFLGTALGSAQANPSLSPSKTHLKMGYNEHYSLGVQRQLTEKDVLEVGYVGNHGVHLNGTNDFNDPTPAPGAVQARRPFQPFSGIVFNTQDTSTNYNSLQVKLDHRQSHGFTGLFAYTYSKFMQFNQSPALGGNTGYEYALSPYDIPHNVAMSGTYQLPVGRGQRFLSTANSLVNSVLGGWHLQTIIVLRSGVPYTPVISGDRANTGVANQRPIINPAGGSPTFTRTLANWFDKSLYTVAPIYTYGNVKANTLRSDLYRQYDASVFKNFTLPGESTLSFRAEFFNISNTTSFNAPTGTGFNTPNAAIDATAGASIISTSVPSRDIQFALKYNF